MPRVPGGDINPEHLILIGQIAQDFGLYTKITPGQRIDLFTERAGRKVPVPIGMLRVRS